MWIVSGQGLTDALSSLHCSPVAHSSATGKECPASLVVSLGGVGWGGILAPECLPTWVGPLPRPRVPSDPRDTGLARIFSFHGEQNKMSMGVGWGCRPEGPGLEREERSCR